MDINRKEIYRYLGYKGNTPDEQILSIIEDCIKMLTSVLAPKHLYRLLKCDCTTKDIIKTENIIINSTKLYSHIKGCNSIIIFAATLGSGVDTIIRKYSKIDMAKTVILQAIAAASIEDYCDNVQEQIKLDLSLADQYYRPRFSPGYGDFSIEHQKDILSLLESQKRIGLMLTDSLLLVPTKSVTAIIGIGNNPYCSTSGCMHCNKLNCEFKKD